MKNIRKSVNKKRTNKIFIAFKVLFAAFITIFIIIYILENREDFISTISIIPFLNIFFSIILMVFGLLMRGVLWAPLKFEITASEISIVKSIYITLVSRMGRYVPGKIWSIVGKTSMSSNDTKSYSANATAVIFETLFVEATFFAVGVIALSISGNLKFVNESYISLIIIMIVFALIIEPHVFTWWANKVLAFLNYPTINKQISLIKLSLIMVGNVFVIILWSFSFISIVIPFTSLDILNIIGLIGVFSLSLVIGFIAIFAPAGIGVRETVLILGLQSIADISIQNAIAITIAIRFVSIVSELIAITGALFALWLSKLYYAR